MYRIAVVEAIFLIWFAFYISMNDGLNRFMYDITGINFEYFLGWTHPIIEFVQAVFNEGSKRLEDYIK